MVAEVSCNLEPRVCKAAFSVTSSSGLKLTGLPCTMLPLRRWQNQDELLPKNSRAKADIDRKGRTPASCSRMAMVSLISAASPFMRSKSCCTPEVRDSTSSSLMESSRLSISASSSWRWASSAAFHCSFSSLFLFLCITSLITTLNSVELCLFLAGFQTFLLVMLLRLSTSTFRFLEISFVFCL